MSGVQTTFGGVCGAKKDGLALHFGLESASLVFIKFFITSILILLLLSKPLINFSYLIIISGINTILIKGVTNKIKNIFFFEVKATRKKTDAKIIPIVEEERKQLTIAIKYNMLNFLLKK